MKKDAKLVVAQKEITPEGRVKQGKVLSPTSFTDIGMAKLAKGNLAAAHKIHLSDVEIFRGGFPVPEEELFARAERPSVAASM